MILIKNKKTNQILFDRNKYMLNHGDHLLREMVKLCNQKFAYLIFRKQTLHQIGIQSSKTINEINIFCTIFFSIQILF